jgi:hypothetical protein
MKEARHGRLHSLSLFTLHSQKCKTIVTEVRCGVLGFGVKGIERTFEDGGNIVYLDESDGYLTICF